MDLAFTERSLRLQREIKRAFDVNGILNPGKILPDV
jgi:FAD/FMN-containing dehydrogenase